MKAREYIEAQFHNGHSKAEVRGMYEDYLTVTESDRPVEFLSYERLAHKIYAELVAGRTLSEFEGQYDSSNADIIERATDLARQRQVLQDQNRILNATARKENQIAGAQIALYKELLANIQHVKPVSKVKPIKASRDALFGIMQLNDHHMNELIHGDEVGNAFDFEIASKRLKKMVDVQDQFFRAYGVDHVLVAFGGDLLNSDRRLDEVLHKATNRARAVLLACFIYRQMLEDLVRRGYRVYVASVSGNESRIGEWNDHSDIQATDNFDFLIHGILTEMFRDEARVQFFNANWKEAVITISGVNLLLLHGESIKTEKNIRDLYAKWAQKSKLLDFILHGHYHSAMLTDISARGASLCGANVYADKNLNLYSRASQNVHIVMADKSIHSLKVDLQNVAGCEPYEVVPELEEYNSKAARKASVGQCVEIPLGRP